ncbi:MAG: CoA-binding protein [Cytophagia bacterium]|nr:CoA-binding protein [Cytophagia bacterium]
MNVLVLGASANPDRYAYRAAILLKQKGHACYLLGQRSGDVDGMPIHNQWPLENSFRPDTITLYLGPTAQVSWIETLMVKEYRRILFNPGTENPALEEALRARGIECIQACTLVLLATNTF